jgi:AcrR family transcriptional regulator
MLSPVVKRGPYSKGVSRREEILTVAVRLFAHNGYRGTSLREIARECGLSVAGLFHYFGSKEELFVAVLDKRDEIDSARATQREGLINVLIDIVERNTEVPGLVELYTTMAASASDPDHPANAYFARHFENFRIGLCQALAEAIEHGDLPRGLDVERTAVLLIAAMDGLQMQWVVDGSLSMADHLRYLWRLILSTAPGTGAPAPAAAPEPPAVEAR